MSYKVSVFNYYADGTRLALSFDTESVLIEDAIMDADIEVLTNRMHNGMNYNERPVRQQIALYPALSFRGF